MVSVADHLLQVLHILIQDQEVSLKGDQGKPNGMGLQTEKPAENEKDRFAI